MSLLVIYEFVQMLIQNTLQVDENICQRAVLHVITQIWGRVYLDLMHSLLMTCSIIA